MTATITIPEARSTATTATKPAAQPVSAHVPATVALTLLSIATAISLCRVFPDWEYLRPMLVVCVGVHAVMCVLRVAKAPAWLALPLGLIAAAELIALIYYRPSTSSGLITGDTIEQFRASMRLVWSQFPRAVAPVPSEGSFPVMAAAALAVAAWLADSFAFRAFGRAEAVVPAGVVFIFTSALGADRNRVMVAAVWIGAAIFAIAALRMAHSRDDSAWMGKRKESLWSALPAAMACALFATTGAVAVAPNLPGAGQKALLDTRNRDGNVTEFVSPMIDLKSKLINRGNVELLSYTSPVPRYLQLSALAKFDGRQWTALAEDLVTADGTLAEAPANSEPFTQNIAIKKLGGKLAPGSATAMSVTWQGDQGFRWAAGAAALFVDGGVKPGIVYQVSAATNDPSQDQLRGATVGNAPDPVYYELPDSLPQQVRDLAAQYTQDATTPYDKVVALQNWFRTAFEYSTVVQRGHSNDAMIDFLTIRKGYCEQFSGTFAAMARTLNIPARVVVGFTPGNLGADGQYHVAGRHAHAWDEVWFDGLGWVLFDPTPGRGAPGAEQHTGVAAAQDTSNGTPGGTGADNGAPTPTVSLPSVNPNRPIGERPSAPVTPRNPVVRKQASNNSSGGWIIAALLLAVAAWVVAMPRVLRRWSRRHTPDPSTRVAAAWASTVRSLSMAGAPRVAGATPLEYARSIDFGRAESVEIARLVTRAVYSPSGVDSGAADRSELLRTEVDAVCRSRMGVVARMLDRLDPRSAWHRIAG